VPTGPTAPPEVVLVWGGVEVASWPLLRHAPPDLRLVEELARLQLAAGRVGACIRVRNPGSLRELLDLVGLAGVVAGEDVAGL
jgi:hypothetical protein